MRVHAHVDPRWSSCSSWCSRPSRASQPTARAAGSACPSSATCSPPSLPRSASSGLRRASASSALTTAPSTTLSSSRTASWPPVLPLVLIVAQPDKGTTMVIGVALLAMLFFAGFDRQVPWHNRPRRPGGHGLSLRQGLLLAQAHPDHARPLPGLLQRRLPAGPGPVRLWLRWPVWRGHRHVSHEVLLPAHGPQRLHLRHHRRGVRPGGHTRRPGRLRRHRVAGA